MADFSKQYLTLEALEDGIIKLIRNISKGNENKYPLKDIQYSKNDGEWIDYIYNDEITVVTGDKIRWKALWNDGVSFFMYNNNFKVNCLYKAYGNPISLLKGDEFADVTNLTIHNGAFAGLFLGEEKLTDVSDISLPATTLTSDCYVAMFQGCKLITSAPELPATIVAYDCYMQMFADCTSLTDAPVLPATKLAISSYYCMFLGCTSLKHVKCYATNITALNCTGHWLNNVATRGVFETAGASWKTGESGIPEGWTEKEITE